MEVVICSKCGTKNRVDESKLTHSEAKCGRCGANLAATRSAVESQPVIISDQSFEREVLQLTGPPVLVDCWAPWCGPCRIVGPVMDQLASESQGNYRVTKLNVDDNPQTAARFQISSIPTMLIFKDGKLVDRLVGAQPKQAIAERLRIAGQLAA